MIDSKYLEFFKAGYTGKTEVYDILSKHQGSVLGHIKWHSPWRQYCFYPSPQCIFNVGCMQDIQAFIGELMATRRKPTPAPPQE